MKILIVGTDKGTIDQCPFEDDSWQVWTMAHRINHFPRVDVGFEVHELDSIKAIGDDYDKWLKKPNIQVIVHPKLIKRYPACDEYPLQDAIDLMGREYFASTFSYILCQAILDGATEIGVYGINLTADDEYQYQRPNAEYLLGLAQGMGIKITVAKGAAILNAPYVYGDGTLIKDPLLQEYEERLTSISDEIDRVDGVRNELHGARHEIEEIIKKLKDRARGAKLT